MKAPQKHPLRGLRRLWHRAVGTKSLRHYGVRVPTDPAVVPKTVRNGVFTGQAATPPPNPQLPAQLGQQIHWMVGKGQSRATIELRPADLGPLKISIETQGDETRIAVLATNPTTQGLLEQQLPRLREWLQDAGLEHSEVEVALGQESDFGEQLAREGDDDSRDGEGRTAAGIGEPGSASAATPGEDAGEWLVGAGVLDLFA